MPGLRRGVFFDLYGTLFLPPDPEEAMRVWVGACYRELAARGLEAAEKGFRELLLRFWRRPAPPAEGLTPFESRIDGVCRELGLALRCGELTAVADSTCAAWQRLMRLDPDAPVALAALAPGRCLRLVSNFDHPRHVRRVLRDTGLERFFDRVVVSGEVGCEKPDPAILALALAETGLRPSDAAYVGDSVVDYEAASAAGLRPVLIRRPGQVSGDPPGHLRGRYQDPEAFLEAAAGRGDLSLIGSLAELPRLLT